MVNNLQSLNTIDKYILMMLINEMRSSDVTLSWVHTSLVLKNFKNLKKVEAFKVLTATISTDSIIDDFEDLKRQRVPFS